MLASLDRLPAVFTIDLYQHVCDSYFGEGRSVYTTAAA